MTGFDETVPLDDDADRDATAAADVPAERAGGDAPDDPEHDSAIPALEDDPDPDER